MRFISYFMMLLLAVSLTACGGGGGSAGTSLGSAPAVLSTTAANVFTLPIGLVQEYLIRGGFPPYVIKNTDPSIVAGFGKNDVLIINSVSQGQASVSIVDSKGTTIALAITVGSPLKLSMDTVQSYVGDVVKVIISGGTPPYRASSVDLAVKPVVSGNQLVMTLGVVGEVDVVVLDANNQSAKVKVTIINGTPQIRLSPNAITTSENDKQPIILTAFGATGAITARSSDPTLLQASIVGNTVTVDTGTNGDRCVRVNQTVTITVTDAIRANATSAITVADNPSGCGVLVVSSSDVTMLVGQTVSVILTGVSDAAYLVASSDPAVATATISAGVITIRSPAPIAAVPATAASGSTAATPGTPGVPAVTGTTNITVTDVMHPSKSVTIKVTVK